ncbi:MAG TPA: pseudouridine-5'-phosphate glycosidase [Candidatus Saccharimonadales bacterium]|nr:pseudouridine-5'-phosphate glycosidase [Candidatus Saccharimonadales bacterium]
MRGGTIRERLHISPEVADALSSGRPVVVLESTLISHGLPYPQNVEVATRSEAAVRGAGAVPATVAIRDGRILVGLEPDLLLELATALNVRKASRPSLAGALADGGWAATTVSATMIAAHTAGIDVFATGGIGGVHRGALGGLTGGGYRALYEGADIGSGGMAGFGLQAPTFDISSDLDELARTPLAVVCAGPKAILDVPATIEYLETHGVPVVAVGVPDVPGFYARSSGVRAPHSVPDVTAAAGLVATHLGLALGSSVLVCVPVPEPDALPTDEARAAVDRAIEDAAAARVAGAELTPWLLARIAELTGGASVVANTALIVNNARVAGELAARLRAGAS